MTLILRSTPPARPQRTGPTVRWTSCAVVLGACAAAFGCAHDERESALEPPPEPPIAGAVLVNELIQPGETHFKNLWQVTFGGQNAEAYWSFAGDRLSMQITENNLDKTDCDKIYVTSADGTLRQVSSGQGVTTCSFFLPSDDAVLYASTHSGHTACPIKPPSEGYTWHLWPDYEIYTSDLRTGEERLLVSHYGYDAEATVSPRGDRIVFTSDRSGDLELYTCDLDGQNVAQVTDELGYDGGAFFNHRGDLLVFRTTAWTPGEEAAEQARYREDLQRYQVRPNRMEIYTIRPDGTGRKQVTALGGAAFAPYFTPDDEHIIFSSNHEAAAGAGLNFDLYMCDLDGNAMERVTTFDGPPGKQFDGFPMFSPDGRFLAFSSNRGDGKAGDTNVFVAEWMP